MIELFDTYKGYKEPEIHTINKYVHIATYKPLNTKDKEIVAIVNTKDSISNPILLYYNTILDIVTLLNNKKKIKNKRKSAAKKDVDLGYELV